MAKKEHVLNVKDSNPKDAIGTRKPRSFSSMSWGVLREASVGMLEGAMKYGRHNYRIAGVRASVYFDSTLEHMVSWWEGEDIDPDSGLPHPVKAIDSLLVLCDAILNDMMEDDRPPVRMDGTKHRAKIKAIVDGLMDKYPATIRKAPYTQKSFLAGDYGVVTASGAKIKVVKAKKKK